LLFLIQQINKYAFSGGQETVEMHRERGGDCNVDISYQYLKHFLESDEELIEIEKVINIILIYVFMVSREYSLRYPLK